MAGYNSLKVEDLQAELTKRGLGFTENDKKADLVALLENNDAEKSADTANATVPVDNVNADEYALSDTVKAKGYKAKIANGLIIVHKTIFSKDKDHNGKQIVITEAHAEVQTGYDAGTGKPVMEDTGSVIKNIIDAQLKELVYAGVIVLTPAQEIMFREKFFNLKP